MDEQLLTDHIQRGDEKAFKTLVETYNQLVFRTCMGFVHDSDDAEDLAQEVFIEVFHSIHKFRKESKLSTWIYRIAANKSLNFVRDNKRKKFFHSIEDAFQKNEHAEDMYKQPDLLVEHDQRKTNLYKAIDSLSERQKVAFTMSKFDDLSYQEISEIMGLSISSVESLIHRAKINLQKKLYKCYKKGI